MKTYIVITSINEPSEAITRFAELARERRYEFLVIGDQKGPASYDVDGCRYYSYNEQLSLQLTYASRCPPRQYSRKNIGYLIAFSEGAERIYETDDDNLPLVSFELLEGPQVESCETVSDGGCTNVYQYFGDTHVWPRGFPLEHVLDSAPQFDTISDVPAHCPIIQGLADDNPDVDAIYRLTGTLPISFKPGLSIALKNGSWCPFNSQSTTWFKEAFPLLYLPTHCTFRMTDIWRSFIAQRICWENGWNVLFHSPHVFQRRNEHSLLDDFESEIPGYLSSNKFVELLKTIKIRRGVEYTQYNLIKIYSSLIDCKFFKSLEIDLLESWLADIEAAGG